MVAVASALLFYLLVSSLDVVRHDKGLDGVVRSRTYGSVQHNDAVRHRHENSLLGLRCLRRSHFASIHVAPPPMKRFSCTISD